jgi:hypothetical protein
MMATTVTKARAMTSQMVQTGLSAEEEVCGTGEMEGKGGVDSSGGTKLLGPDTGFRKATRRLLECTREVVGSGGSRGCAAEGCAQIPGSGRNSHLSAIASGASLRNLGVWAALFPALKRWAKLGCARHISVRKDAMSGTESAALRVRKRRRAHLHSDVPGETLFQVSLSLRQRDCMVVWRD